jgi:hypothetical protein
MYANPVKQMGKLVQAQKYLLRIAALAPVGIFQDASAHALSPMVRIIYLIVTAILILTALSATSANKEMDLMHVLKKHI